MDGEDHGANLA